MRDVHDPTKPRTTYRREKGSAFVAALAPHLSRNTPEFRELADRAAGFLDDGKGAETMAEALGCEPTLVRTVCLLRTPPGTNG